MTHIQPLRIDELRDPELKALVERCDRVGMPGSLFALILARAPGHARPLLDAMLLSYTSGNVDHRLKEIIRVRLARRAGLEVKGGCEDYEGSALFSDKEKWALRYADRMYVSSASVDAAFYEEMKKHYSEAEIMELGAFIALWYGMQVFMRTLGSRG